MQRHWETRIYTYAVMLTQGDKIKPENLSGVRRKALNRGHTEGELLCIENDPARFIRTGSYA